MRPCPRRYIHYVWHMDGRDKPSLQAAMGMIGDDSGFKFILTTIRQTCLDHGVDLNLPYGRQDEAVLDTVKKHVLNKVPRLRGYDGGWPVTVYFKTALKSHLSSLCSPKPPTPSSGRHKHTKSHSTGKRGSLCEKPVSKHTSQMARRRQRPAAVRNLRETPTLCSHNTSVSEDDERTPATLTRIRTPIPNASPSISSTPILNRLLSLPLPRPDAERIAALFTTLGIKDMSYLRMFARMYARDGWLRELRQVGQLSEIEMRLLREMLDHVARE
ncbi:hypothetical protein C8Q76DRAFT_716489 [Earliella scabrosa]|nr:hypothetical protein C8Q76DRAFT_716489 [Earliella scabrosa]